MADKTKEIAVVLLNLGGPDSLKAVRPFLMNIFSDRDIIRLGPSFMQKPLAFLISRLRSKKTEGLYGRIGGKSPILDITTAQAEALEKALNTMEDGGRRKDENSSIVNRSPRAKPTGQSSIVFKVYIGMRYWHPFICDTVKRVIEDGMKHVVVLSLYPHYSRATTGSAVAEFKRVVDKFRIPNSEFRIQYIDHWYDFPPYIECLTKNISEEIADFNSEPACPAGRPVELLYSAHSLPEDFINQGDPYLEHINATINAVNALILSSLPKGSSPIRSHLSFQSRSGPVKWLSPSTDESIIRLAKQGVKNLLVVPISFVSDHIETLYEIDILYRDIALKNGINLKRCQSLNVSDKFISALKELVLRNTQTIADKDTDDHR